MAQDIVIGGRLHSAATGNTVARANEILDDAKGKKQNVINQEVDNEIGSDSAAGTIKGRIKNLETAVGSGGSVDERIAETKAEIIGDAAADYNTLGKVEDKIQETKSEILGDAASDYNTLGKVEDKIQAETSRAEAAEGALDNAKANKATTLEGYGIIDAYTKNETYTKTEVNGLVDTPHQNYVTVLTYAALIAIDPGSTDTIYRVSNYDGSVPQVDVTKYSEYAWDGTQYVFLCIKSQIDEVFDISVYNNNAKYADLEAALGTDGANVPQTLRRGGMSVKYIQSSDNKYVQYRLMSDTFNTTPANWQGVDDEPTAESNNLVKSDGIEKAVANVSNAFDISNNQHVNKVVCYIMESGSPRVDLTATNHRLGIAYYTGGLYYNMLYLSRTGTSAVTVFQESYNTAAECIASLKANPVRTNGTITIVFNGDNLSNESARYDFKLIRPVNERNYKFHPNIYDNYFRNDGIFNVGSPANSIIGEMYITDKNMTVRYVSITMFTTTNSKIDLKFFLSYSDAGGSIIAGYIIPNMQFNTRQDAVDYYNGNLAGKIVSMSDGTGFVYFKPIENVDSIAINSYIAYPNVDVHDIIYSPMIERYLTKNYRFNRSSVANQMVNELYINPNIIDYSTINFIRISCGTVFSDNIYNIVYVYRTGGLSTVTIYQKVFDTLSDAIDDYIGFKGNGNGYVLFNDEFANKLEAGTYIDVYLSDINIEMLSLKNNPRIERYFNHTIFGKTVVWEGDSIAAGNEYGNSAWRKPIELMYGVLGTSYAIGGSVITDNIINPDTGLVQGNISARIDTEIMKLSFLILN